MRVPSRSLNEKSGAQARRVAIRRLIRTQRIRTQEALVKELAREGLEVTQATLSRDLSQLRAVRVTLPDGGMAYELPTSSGLSGEVHLREVGEMVISVNHNQTLVVVLTQPGTAPAVARAIDVARLTEVLGSLAGDDTIFIAPDRRFSAEALAERLKAVFSRGES